MTNIHSETLRIEDLYQLEILDTDPESVYDNIVEMASMICDSPVALLSFIDSDRQWFKARKGMSIRETARDVSFCSYAILQDGPLIIPDAREDERFKNNPFVTSGPRIRFYAGVPLKSGRGSGIGTLCVIGYAPKKLTDKQITLLETLAKQASTLLDNRKTQITQKRKLCHEINNPLSIVLLSSTALKRRFEKNMDLQGDLKRLNQAIDGAARIGKIVTGLKENLLTK